MFRKVRQNTRQQEQNEGEGVAERLELGRRLDIRKPNFKRVKQGRSW